MAQLYDSGLTVELRRKVVYVCEEPTQVERVLYGLKKHASGAKPKELREWFKVMPSRRLSPDKLGALIAEIVRTHTVIFNGYPVAPLIVLDTSNATIDLDNENDNAEVGRAIAAIKQNLGTGACWLVAHTPKALQRAEASELMARGAGAFTGDANWTAIIPFTSRSALGSSEAIRLRRSVRVRREREGHVLAGVAAVTPPSSPRERHLRLVSQR